MELGETTKLIFEQVRQNEPVRVVFDSPGNAAPGAELAALSASNPRSSISLRAVSAPCCCSTTCRPKPRIFSFIPYAGVIVLEQLALEYGAERRRLRVTKMRGIAFRGGYHDFTIERGGLSIFPRLIAAEHHKEFHGEPISSGSDGLDALLGGGLHRGTSALFIGGAGVGKSTMALAYAVAAAARGEDAVLFAFDEGLGTIFARADSLGVALRNHVTSGRLAIQQIDPAEMSPGEFVAIVREAVEKQNARVVVIDSLNGYLNAMPNEKFLILQMHDSELSQPARCRHSRLAQHGLMGLYSRPWTSVITVTP
jgi:circadian clock protein KaiC